VTGQHLSKAAQALSEVMGSYRYELTPFEAAAWKRVIDAVSEDRFLAFLTHHYSISSFAPKPSDATKFLDLSVNPDVAYTKLERLVAELGPYKEPSVDDDPILVTTVLMLGGWVSVNEKMPDRSQSYQVKEFRDRFDACFTQALVQVRINKQMPTERLTAIGHQPLSLPAPDRVASLGFTASPSSSNPGDRPASMSRSRAEIYSAKPLAERP
jgi:hypothetical protein